MASDPLRPLTIGNVTLPNNLILSPMAGYSDLPFRVLCREHGAGLVCTEMVSATGIKYEGLERSARARTVARERPVSIQLFGTDVNDVANAAKEVGRNCEILGFNMGCPAHQIKRTGCGAALLDKPDLAMELVRAIKDASTLPLIVKMRAGNTGAIDVAQWARGLERAGADAIIFHARTAAQGYSGKADWTLIQRVKAAVGIPVIGNGDVTDGPAAARALASSACDGLALGRATLGDPHVFRRIAHYLQTGKELGPQAPEARLRELTRYLEMAADVGLSRAHVYQQMQQFTRGLYGAARLRQELHGRQDFGEMARLIESHVRNLPAPRRDFAPASA